MPKTLHLNTALIKEDYRGAMSKALDEAGYGYMQSVISAMRTQAGAGDVTVESADEGERLVRKIIGGAFAVLDSFGSGSLADANNPAFNDYLSSNLYNPARSKRPGAPITGRPKGEYTDVFGEPAYSSGAMKGLNLEKLPDSPITAQSPSGAFQDADSWLIASNKVWEEVDKATKAFLLTQIRRRWTFG